MRERNENHEKRDRHGTANQRVKPYAPDQWPSYGATNYQITPDPRQIYGTPWPFMGWINEHWQQRDLDVCAIEENRKCPYYIGPPGYAPAGEAEGWIGSNGLEVPWIVPGSASNAKVWCNPGFDDVGPWLRKAALEAHVNNAHCLVITHVGMAEWFESAYDDCFRLYRVYPRIDYDAAPGIITSDSNPRDTFLWEFRREQLKPGLQRFVHDLKWPKPAKIRGERPEWNRGWQALCNP